MPQHQYLRKGYLLKCPQKALNPFKQKWQSRWFVLYGNSEHGRVRIEYHDNEKSWQLEKGKRVIPLSNCVSIKPVWNKDYNHVIEIVIQDKTIHLAASSKDEEKTWFKDLCKAVFGHSNRSSIVQVVDKPAPDLDFGYHSLDRSSTDGITDSPRILHTVEESMQESDVGSHEELRNISTSSNALHDNTCVDGTAGSCEKLQKTSSVASELSSLVSFESGFDDAASLASTITEGSSYPVTVRPTLASQKAGLNGTYLLQINPLNITLIDVPSQSPVCEWPIQYLRRYGRGRTKFSFEASEKCKHGKGVYTFNTLEGDSIFHLVDMHARGISMRNQMLRKRTSMPEGFRPLGAASKRLHHSEGKLIDKLPDMGAVGKETPRFGDSAHDLFALGPGDSVSQAGTLPKDLQAVAEVRAQILDKSSNMQSRGMSIGSGISLEIAQNISHTGEEFKDGKSCERIVDGITASESNDKIRVLENKPSDILDTSYEETMDEVTTDTKKLDVSTIEEESLVQTLESEQTTDSEDKIVTNDVSSKQHSDNGISRTPTTTVEETNNVKKLKSTSVRRSSSLKLPSALKRSNSNKDASIKKSQSVKRSSSFRSRFFKSKSKEKLFSKSDQNLNSAPPKVADDIDVKIAQQEKVKEILAKAIEDDMNRNSESEVLNGDIDHIVQEKVKRRKLPVRHKSNEMLGNGSPDKFKAASARLSSSFAGYDYKGHIVLSKTNSIDKENEEEEMRRLQRRTQSVMKKVELYEGLKRQAEEYRFNSYTFWRRKQSMKDTKVMGQEIVEMSDV